MCEVSHLVIMSLMRSFVQGLLNRTATVFKSAKQTTLPKSLAGYNGFASVFKRFRRHSSMRSSISSLLYVRAIPSTVKTRAYDLNKSPRLMRKQLIHCSSCNMHQQDVSLNQKEPTIRKSTHKVCYWDSRNPLQYNSVNEPVPLKRPSASGKTIITVQTVKKPRIQLDQMPNVKLHTWNALEPTQYGYWFNRPITRRSASEIRLISRKQHQKMAFTKSHN